MNNYEYQLSNLVLQGYDVLEHVYNPEDKKLFGRYGFIHLNRSGSFGVGSNSFSVIKKHLNYEARRNEEYFGYHSAEEFQRLTKILGIPKRAAKQLPSTLNFGIFLPIKSTT